MRNIFNQKAIDAKRKSYTNIESIQILKTPLKATLFLGVCISIGTLFWSIFAKIPFMENCIGVLTPVNKIFNVYAKSSGVISLHFNDDIQLWEQLSLNFSLNPTQLSNTQIVKLSQLLLTKTEVKQCPVNSKDVVCNKAKTDSTNIPFIKRNKLIYWIKSNDAISELATQLNSVNRIELFTQDKVINIQKKQHLLSRELASRSAYLADMKQLANKQYVSKSKVLSEQSTVDNIRTQIETNNTQLITLKESLYEASDLLRNKLSIVINKGMIFAKEDSYLDKILPNNGQYVKADDLLFGYSQIELDAASVIPAYVSSSTSSKIRPGMNLLATPEGYNRSEVGGILGKVIYVDLLPSDLNDIQNRLGSKAIAQAILKLTPTPTLIEVKLSQNIENNSRIKNYKWSGGANNTNFLNVSSLVDIQITTEFKRPIQLVMPTIKKAFGISPPDRMSNGKQRNASKQGSND